jgi:hypothetical protein
MTLMRRAATVDVWLTVGYGPGVCLITHLIPTKPCTDWINFSES